MKVEKFSQQNSILNRHGYRSSSQESSIIIISGYNLRQIDYTMLPFVRLCVSFLPPLRWGGGAICTGQQEKLRLARHDKRVDGADKLNNRCESMIFQFFLPSPHSIQWNQSLNQHRSDLQAHNNMIFISQSLMIHG